jgi:hypothetical protein
MYFRAAAAKEPQPKKAALPKFRNAEASAPLQSPAKPMRATAPLQSPAKPMRATAIRFALEALE